jgi:protein-S-isoprenylcysteine O-methyltransferase
VFAEHPTRSDARAFTAGWNLIVFQPRLLVLLYLVLLGLFLAGEVMLLWRAKRRRKPGDRQAPEDRGFVSRALLIFLVCNLLAMPCLRLFPAASFGTVGTSCIGLGVMLAGLLLRWWSIAHLGRFFTVDVMIASGHHVVDSGPYRLVRHPSYAGAALVVVGIGLCFGNLASFVVLLVPFLALLMRRMRVEEAALLGELGDSYRAYMGRTKRLIPGLW